MDGTDGYASCGYAIGAKERLFSKLRKGLGGITFFGFWKGIIGCIAWEAAL